LWPGTGFDVAGDAFSFAAADMNDDGEEDVVVCRRYEQKVSIWLGDGEGGFAHESTVPCEGTPVMVLTADFDADGDPDAATSNQTTSTVVLLENDGSGNLTVVDNLAAGSSVTGIVAGFFTGDSCVDLAVMNAVTGASLMRVYEGHCDFTFTEIGVYEVGDRPHVLGQVVGDFDGDGDDDIAVGSAYLCAEAVEPRRLVRPGQSTLRPSER
jgi:hypothetical protein